MTVFLTRDAVDATGRNLRDERKRVDHERDVQTLRECHESCPQLRDLWREDDTRHWIGVTWRDGRVTRLNLFNQGLSGSLPRLQGLTSLEIANFPHNQLSGSIPEKLFEGLTSLRRVGLMYNKVSGLIPENLFEGLTSLYSADFRGNQLSGSIPEKLFKGLTSLKQVWLDRNPVSGPIPEKLFEGLTSLQEVWLHDNQVSGSIPEGLRGIFKLSECPPDQEDDTQRPARQPHTDVLYNYIFIYNYIDIY